MSCVSSFPVLSAGAVAVMLASLPAAETEAQALSPPSNAIDRAIEEAERSLSREPDASETLIAALRWFRIEPSAIDGLRSAARARAAMPIVSGGYALTDRDDRTLEAQVQSTPYNRDRQGQTLEHQVGASLLWDLRDAVFNAAEIQAYGLVGVQRDVLLEVTRAYFLRQQLVIRLLVEPPAEPMARFAMRIRVREFTAILDSLTGGWFSEQCEARGAPSPAALPRPR